MGRRDQGVWIFKVQTRTVGDAPQTSKLRTWFEDSEEGLIDTLARVVGLLKVGTDGQIVNTPVVRIEVRLMERRQGLGQDPPPERERRAERRRDFMESEAVAQRLGMGRAGSKR